MRFTDQDRARLERAGIALADAVDQIERLNRPRRYAALDRPCTRGDGIVVIDESEAAHLESLADEAVAAGRLVKFVPASGAASRMFKELLAHTPGGSRSAEVERFFSRFTELPLVSELPDCADEAAVIDVVRARHARLAKGLLPFHGYQDGARTAFEEHLEEARELGITRLHLTVSPEHEEGFRSLLAERGGALNVVFSHQQSSTDTLCVDETGAPLRDASGELVLRPGGHGALIENLDALDADLVWVKNIDNIQTRERRVETERWARRLTGLLVEVQSEVHDAIRAVRQGVTATAVDVLARRFDRQTPAEADTLIAELDRPLRVCAMVENTGEPGGGPFWARGAEGVVRPQIVEGAEVDSGDEAQRDTLAAATHFNPVFLVCGLGDADGGRYDLHRFIDADAVIVTEKSWDGHALRALERPGLWNGAMALWNTVFVEAPMGIFSPVKTVTDLLRPEHQAD